MKPISLVILGLVLASCADDLCGNDLIYSVSNYNGSKEALVFVRNCGATTDYSIHVSILSLDDGIPRESGNTFIADSDHGKAPTAERNALQLKIEWTARETVTIIHSSDARVFKSETSVGDVSVVYQSD